MGSPNEELAPMPLGKDMPRSVWDFAQGSLHKAQGGLLMKVPVRILGLSVLNCVCPGDDTINEIIWISHGLRHRRLRAKSYPPFQPWCANRECPACCDGSVVVEASSSSGNACSLASGLHSSCICTGSLDRIGPYPFPLKNRCLQQLHPWVNTNNVIKWLTSHGSNKRNNIGTDFLYQCRFKVHRIRSFSRKPQNPTNRTAGSPVNRSQHELQGHQTAWGMIMQQRRNKHQSPKSNL